MKKKSVVLYEAGLAVFLILMAVGVAIGIVNSQEDCKVKTAQAVAVAK